MFFFFFKYNYFHYWNDNVLSRHVISRSSRRYFTFFFFFLFSIPENLLFIFWSFHVWRVKHARCTRASITVLLFLCVSLFHFCFLCISLMFPNVSIYRVYPYDFYSFFFLPYYSRFFFLSFSSIFRHRFCKIFIIRFTIWFSLLSVVLYATPARFCPREPPRSTLYYKFLSRRSRMILVSSKKVTVYRLNN